MARELGQVTITARTSVPEGELFRSEGSHGRSVVHERATDLGSSVSIHAGARGRSWH